MAWADAFGSEKEASDIVAQLSKLMAEELPKAAQSAFPWPLPAGNSIVCEFL